LKESAPSLKVCLSIGGWGSGNFSEMAADDALRKSFAADCARVVEAFNLDGIDIDWEYPTSNAAGISASPDDKDNFTLLMRDIREAIGKDKLLTLATVCSARYKQLRMVWYNYNKSMKTSRGGPEWSSSFISTVTEVLRISYYIYPALSYISYQP
jgi:chitinase